MIEAYTSGTSANQLMKQFGLGKGSVLAVLDEAGVLRRVNSPTATHLDEAASLYIEQQWSLQQIADHLGFATGTIYRHLKQRGVPMRRPWDHLHS